MALLYTKDDSMDCDGNGEGVGMKKIKAKKRRLDSIGDKQNKVIRQIWK